MSNSFSAHIKKNLYNILRNCVKIYLTGNLGSVIEDDEKLTCYVKKGKCKQTKYDCTISCDGIDKSKKELAKTYKLNKPILYVIDGLQFEKKEVFIYGHGNCDIHIKNCRFNWGLNVLTNGKCTLEDTVVRSFGRLSIVAEETVIKNMDIRNGFAIVGNYLDIFIVGKKRLDILNSNIGKEGEKTTLYLSSRDELNLVHSKLAGNKIDCKSKTMTSDMDSSFIASDKMNITTDNFNFKQINTISSAIIYNGTPFEGGYGPVELAELVDPLRMKRLEFIDILKKIKNECEKLNSEKMDQGKDPLNNQPICKTLKR